MKAFVLYRERSDHAREVETWAHDFESQTNKKVELIDMDTREGDAKARVYDITRFPAVVAVRDDGQMLRIWSEDYLPRIQEVSAYTD